MTPDPAQVDVAELRACDVADCNRAHRARGLCSTHLARLARRGSLEPTVQYAPGPDRLWAGVEKTPTCWLWRGAVTLDGYGQITVNYKNLNTHRYAWELLRGPVPDGQVLDHICRVRRCVNPDHLQPVSGLTNTLRGIGPSAINSRKTHCVRGHEFTPENTYRAPSEPNKRKCRKCARIRDKRRSP